MHKNVVNTFLCELEVKAFRNENMKALLVIIFICTLHIQLGCANGKLYDTKIIVNTYPKEVHTLQKNIHIKNPRKFGKVGALERRKANFKKPIIKKGIYTVFPQITQKKTRDNFENFNVQEDLNRKSRVKKVLPAYDIFLIRKKRSAVAHINNTKLDKVAENNKKIKRSRNVRKRIKRIGLNKNVRNSTVERIKGKRKPKVLRADVPFTNNKKRNINIRHGKTRMTSQLKYAKKHRNQPKLIAKSQSSDLLGHKKYDLRKPKQENKARGNHNKKVNNRRLIAGRDAMIQDYPYVVSIQKDKQHWCAGALLNQRLVITTANCVWKAKRISRMRVRAGSRHMERGGQLVKIQEVVKHPKWSIRSLPDNDVALLLLSNNIKVFFMNERVRLMYKVNDYETCRRFSDSVHGVDLPNRAMWPAFEDVWVTSWGAERRDGIFKSVGVTLQVYHAMLLDHNKCNNVTMRFGIAVSHNFICVSQTGRRAPCTRDTGAPAVSDGILWGLASWGIRKLCGTERFPAMFSYLASRSNLDFITNATHYLMSDKRYYPYDDRFVLNQAITTSTAATTDF